MDILINRTLYMSCQAGPDRGVRTQDHPNPEPSALKASALPIEQTWQTYNIIQNMDNTKITTVTLCLDLSKAFDTLNFDILLNKLQNYGVTLLLINSYLNEIYQYTKYDNFDSTLLEIKTGIPQGSNLGPLFF